MRIGVLTSKLASEAICGMQWRGAGQEVRNVRTTIGPPVIIAARLWLGHVGLPRRAHLGPRRRGLLRPTHGPPRQRAERLRGPAQRPRPPACKRWQTLSQISLNKYIIFIGIGKLYHFTQSYHRSSSYSTLFIIIILVYRRHHP